MYIDDMLEERGFFYLVFGKSEIGCGKIRFMDFFFVRLFFGVEVVFIVDDILGVNDVSLFVGDDLLFVEKDLSFMG